ncbi:MAG: hypothetical protein P5694_08780 [Limnospira sp. PMC 1286.21]|nr:hypothetical protein [Limnospira sp. PMC 1286.21]
MAIPLCSSEAIAWGIAPILHLFWLWQSMIHFPANRQPLGW